MPAWLTDKRKTIRMGFPILISIFEKECIIFLSERV